MKKLVLLLAFALSSSLIFAQSTDQDSTLTRKEESRIRKTVPVDQRHARK